MSKEVGGVMGWGFPLVAAVFAGGMRIGTLTERIESQSKQIDRLSTEVSAVNAHFIAWAGDHTEGR